MKITNKLFNCLILSCLLTISFNSQASLINNGNFITDTNMNYDWLNLDQTSGYSYNSIISELGSGGLFDEWTLASFTDVHSLFDAAGGDGTYNDGNAGSAVYDNLIGNWGAGANHSSNSIWFHVVDTLLGGNTSGGILRDNGNFVESNNFSPPSIGYDRIGAALYRTSTTSNSNPVPAPGTLALFALGLAGFVFSRKKKTT